MSVTAKKHDVTKVSAFGYTPTVDNLDAVRANVAKAASAIATAVVKIEESNLSNLIVSVADFYALYFCQNGQWPAEKDATAFVHDAMGGKENATSSYKTLDSHLVTARKAAALVSQGARTGVYVGWWRVENSKQQVSKSVACPAGKGWVRLLMLNKSIYAPNIEKTVKKKTVTETRPSIDEPGSRAEIDLAYAILIQNKGSNGAGKLTAEKRKNGVGAGQGKTATPAETLAEIASDLKDPTNLLALIGAMVNAVKSSKVRAVIAKTENLRNAMADLYVTLDAHVMDDGTFSIKPVDKENAPKLSAAA
jgi:hypothetical protein